MEQKSYEVLTDNWPRKDPAGAGAIVLLTEPEAKYSVLSGDLKLVASKEKLGRKPKGDTPPSGSGEGGGSGDGEGAGGNGAGEGT